MTIRFRHGPSFLTYLTLTTLRTIVVSILLMRTLRLRGFMLLAQVTEQDTNLGAVPPPLGFPVLRFKTNSI